VAEHYGLASSTAYPLERPVELESLSQIKKLIAILPEAQRSVITLRDVQGYSYDEISKILDMNLSQVKVNLHRGRKQVRTQMMELDNYGV